MMQRSLLLRSRLEGEVCGKCRGSEGMPGITVHGAFDRERKMVSGKGFGSISNDGGFMTRDARSLHASDNLRRTLSSTIVETPVPQTKAQSPLNLNLRRAESTCVSAFESLVPTNDYGADRKKLARSRKRALVALPVQKAGEQKGSVVAKALVKESSKAGSFSWTELPFTESDLPKCRGDEHEISNLPHTGIQRTKSLDSHAYIYSSLTLKALTTHELVRLAMVDLQNWTMQAPAYCCLSYRHDAVGAVVTLPWPDMEACDPEEIHDFVNTVNEVEGRSVFFHRFEKSPYWVPRYRRLHQEYC